MNTSAQSVPVFSLDEFAAMGSRYQEVGAIVVRGVLEAPYIRRFTDTLATLLRARLDSLGVSTTTDNLDELYNLLCGVSPKHVREIIMIARDLPIFYECIANPTVHRILSALIPSCKIFQVVHDICLVRIDPPDDETRSFDWHQDFPYNVMSESTVTVWAPLTAVTRNMGCLVVVPGSHRSIHPVDFWAAPPKNAAQFAGHKVFALHDVNAAELDAQSIEVPEMEAGDVLFLHSCVLHRSGKNQSERARWVCNPRFGDALDGPLVQRGWNVVRDKSPHVFSTVYPDLTHPQSA